MFNLLSTIKSFIPVLQNFFKHLSKLKTLEHYRKFKENVQTFKLREVTEKMNFFEVFPLGVFQN